jgi:hypothetical protein
VGCFSEEPGCRGGMLLSVFSYIAAEAVISEARRGFCSPGTKYFEFYEFRDTILIESHIFIPGYKFYYLYWRGRSTNSCKSVLRAGAKAKTMTSLFTLLSVLWAVVIYSYINSSPFITLVGYPVSKLYS